MKIGAVILAGGKSRRMGGVDKAALMAGEESFIKRILSRLKMFDELLLSVGEADSHEEYERIRVVDIQRDCGPIGGILSALCECRSDGLFIAACDMPLLQAEFAEYLLSYLSTDYDAFVVTDRQGRIHPLCGIYLKTAVPALKRQISRRNYRMIDALKSMRVKYISMQYTRFSDNMLFNVNTPEQYRQLQGIISKPPVIAVSGVKNSGKTTLICAVMPILKANGLRAAVIKHDGHDFEPDVPDTDSYRLRKAGADQVAVYSNTRAMLIKERPDIGIDELLSEIHDCDLIILEGGKHSRYPKIEIIRSCISGKPVCDTATFLAICTDLDIDTGIPVVSLTDYQAIASIMMRCAAL